MKQAWVATRKGLFELQRGKGRWAIGSIEFLGDPVTTFVLDPPRRRAFAALNLGHFGAKLHRSEDAGQTWTEVAAPAYPAKPEGRDDPIPWNLVQIWTLAVEADSGRLWAGTIPGGLFYSDDGAASWHLVRSLWERPERLEWNGGGYDWPGVHSICLDPRAPEQVVVAVSSGGIWSSPDRGQSWELWGEGLCARYMPEERWYDPGVQDPHRVRACQAAPDVLWCQHHSGIFRSEDRGRHWQEIENPPESRFGFAVAAHPKDPKTAWFVPAESDARRIPIDGRPSVLRTRDGGQSFDVLRRGLPEVPAYDLVYRHGLDVDESGRALMMGSTTGHLWWSGDGGDQWESLPLGLPPIYAVACA